MRPQLNILLQIVMQVALTVIVVLLMRETTVTAPTEPEAMRQSPQAVVIVTATPYPHPTSTPSPWPTDTPSPTATAWPTLTQTPTPTATTIATPTDIPPPTATMIRIDAPNAVCPCFHGDVRACREFRSQAEAQACYGYCVALGMGDVHGLDEAGNGQACSMLPTQPIWQAAAVPLQAAPAQPQPAWPTVPAVIVPTPLLIAPMPTQGATCECGADVYNCSDFLLGNAQGCFDYCWDQGFGDVHRLDQDNDLLACEGDR